MWQLTSFAWTGFRFIWELLSSCTGSHVSQCMPAWKVEHSRTRIYEPLEILLMCLSQQIVWEAVIIYWGHFMGCSATLSDWRDPNNGCILDWSLLLGVFRPRSSCGACCHTCLLQTYIHGGWLPLCLPGQENDMAPSRGSIPWGCINNGDENQDRAGREILLPFSQAISWAGCKVRASSAAEQHTPTMCLPSFPAPCPFCLTPDSQGLNIPIKYSHISFCLRLFLENLKQDMYYVKRTHEMLL